MKLFDFFRKKTPSSSTPPLKNFEDLHCLDAIKNKQEIQTASWWDEKTQSKITARYTDEKNVLGFTSEKVDKKTHTKNIFDYQNLDDGGYNIFATEMPDDFITEFYRLSEIIGSGKNSIKDRLDACEKSFPMLEEFCRWFLLEDDELPALINCRYYGVELYLRLGDWENAERVINLCINAKSYNSKDDEEYVLDMFHSYRKAAETALPYIAEHPGCLQKDMYKALGLEGNDKEQLKHFLRSSLQIRKEKYNSTNKLFINTDAVV